MGRESTVLEIEALMHDYFEALYTQDLSLFDKVFHPSCVLYHSQNGKTLIRGIEEYRDIVKNRESPQEKGSHRDEKIVMLDMLSSEMGLVKVRLLLNDSIMEDYLNIIKVSEQWFIVSKMWSKFG